MDDRRSERVDHIRAQVSSNAYRVDPGAVAEALLRRLLQLTRDGHS